ncbi:MAG TPA: sigma-70 family RNA polymerase sigma factor [Chloroflexota bacterium]|nr:sigma-70 family RNA polymerase sigma factor [Chloroflexota bacterium]
MVLAPSALARWDTRTLDGLSDEALVKRVAARDGRSDEALAVLYGRYAGAVHALGVRLLRDAAQAEHLVQEVFCRVWQYAGTYEPGRVKWSTWLLRLARNKAISELRAASCRPRGLASVARFAGRDPERDGVAEAPEAPDDGPEVPELVWAAERRRLIGAALARLPLEQRQAVELAYFGGLTHREIAAAQAAPESTVKTRLALGLRKLASDLGARGLHAGTY